MLTSFSLKSTSLVDYTLTRRLCHIMKLLLASPLLASVLAYSVSAQAGTVDGDITLDQSHFAGGAYIISTPGTYKLSTDIVFKPTGTISSAAPEQWMFPDRSTAPYSATPFLLGHFAAIIIQADGVTLDLNGKQLSQSVEHALMQRFFSLIELASSPFPPNVGPAAFGTEVGFEAATNVIIKNGKLGRSSHHAIHGNNNVGVTLSNLDISDFEVARAAAPDPFSRHLYLNSDYFSDRTFLALVATSAGGGHRAQRRGRPCCGHSHGARLAHRRAGQWAIERGHFRPPGL